MSENEETEAFFETVFRLDECDDLTEFLEFAQGKRHEKKEMLSAAEQLLTKGRVRSAYILAMLLSKRGQRDLIISVALSVGGLIFNATTEELNGLKYLKSQVDALSVEQQKEIYDRIIVPLVPHLWASVPAKPTQSDHDRMLRILQNFKAAVPEGFEWEKISCKLCDDSAEYKFHGNMRAKYRVAYYLCKKCGFLFTEEPYWLEDAYSGAVCTNDTDIMARTLRFRAFVSLFLRNLFDPKAKFLDYGGGYGLFVRLMRDIGFDFYWKDKHCQNLFAHGFEGDDDEKYELVTALECFQCFADPIQALDRMLDQSDCVLFTTHLLPDPLPQPDAWDYYALESGQHISFYSKKTLQKLAESRGLVLLSNGVDTHMFSKRNISSKVFGGLSHWQP